MIDRVPRRFRLGFARSAEPAMELAVAEPEDMAEEVTFVAYGEDCLLSGRTVLDGDRLSDMLNAHDEYVLVGVTVERFDGGESFEVDEIAVPRDEIFMVHASEPRGDPSRRHRTMPQGLALKMGPYKVRGDFHSLPGADPVEAFRRRTTMVPLTDARIEYTIRGQPRETRVSAVIVNREQIDWLEAVAPNQTAFPEGPKHLIAKPA